MMMIMMILASCHCPPPRLHRRHHHRHRRYHDLEHHRGAESIRSQTIRVWTVSLGSTDRLRGSTCTQHGVCSGTDMGSVTCSPVLRDIDNALVTDMNSYTCRLVLKSTEGTPVTMQPRAHEYRRRSCNRYGFWHLRYGFCHLQIDAHEHRRRSTQIGLLALADWCSRAQMRSRNRYEF